LAADFPTVREAVQSEGVEYFDPDRPNSLGEALTQFWADRMRAKT